jgi:Flp pilus assembly protein TadG
MRSSLPAVRQVIMKRARPERGAAAVEFALIVLPFLTLVFLLVDLGWIFNQQMAVTTAAREAIRVYTVEQQSNPSGAKSDAEARAQALVTTSLSFAWPKVCSTTVSNEDASVTVSTPLTDLTGWLSGIAPSAKLTATGTMRCGG